ncbi:MAG: patatin-like phospholipase family protein, partial [Nitrososphaerales archaeon]
QMMHSRRTDSMLRTVAVLPAGGEVSVTAFCGRLVKAFASMGSTLHFNSNSLDNHLGKGMAQTPLDGHQNSKVIGWLNEQEEKFCFVVYESDLSPSNWTKRCIRQADRIIFVGDAVTAPTLNSVEEEILERGPAGTIAQSELVLLHHDKDRQPVGTKKWIELRNVDKHHHVLMSSQADFERLTRSLTGKAYGLVLGGGGARGFAHIGVIRALKEANIPIDLIGGTSIGAIISALHAMGHDWDEIIRISRECWIDMRPLKDFTIPLMSFITGNRINKMLNVMFGEKEIVDLWVKYFCISANLSRAKMIVHEDGLLKKATRASISVPGVGPPLIHEGELLVDGGVINNLPVDVMRGHCKGTVIAVDVSPVVDLTAKFEHLDSFSGGWALWNRINPFVKKVSFPNILRILWRASQVGSIQSVESTKGAADHYLHPPIDGIDMFNWNALEEIVEIGYRYAQEKITEWNDTPT